MAGRFLGAENGHARFANDLRESVAWGDERYLQLRKYFSEFAERQGLPDPMMAEPEPFDEDGLETVDLGEFGAVLYTSGFRPNYASWLPWPDAFDEEGFPIQEDGASPVMEGLHFVGLHFMRKRKSALLCGVGEDAGVVAEAIARR